MPTTQFPRLESPPENANLQSLLQYVGKLANITAILLKELDYLLNGSLDANNIRANSITTDLLKAGSVTTDILAAGAVTAEKITVDELSAISANLGHITAGLVEAIEIYGSLIATKTAGNYPRIELSSDDNLLNAEGNANESISIDPSADGTPSVVYQNTSTSTRAQEFLSDGIYNILSLPGTGITIFSGDDLTLSALGLIRFQNWAKLYNEADSTDLQTTLDSLSTSITSLSTSVDALTTTVAGKATAGSSTGSAGPFNGGIPVGTALAVAGGGSVTWAGISAHSHTQT